MKIRAVHETELEEIAELQRLVFRPDDPDGAQRFMTYTRGDPTYTGINRVLSWIVGALWHTCGSGIAGWECGAPIYWLRVLAVSALTRIIGAVDMLRLSCPIPSATSLRPAPTWGCCSPLSDHPRATRGRVDGGGAPANPAGGTQARRGRSIQGLSPVHS